MTPAQVSWHSRDCVKQIQVVREALTFGENSEAR